MRPKQGPGNAGDMTEDNHTHPVSLCPHQLHEQDCNYNCATPHTTTTLLQVTSTTSPDTIITTSHLSNVSSNDGEAVINDASDYQWFMDYGYNPRDSINSSSATAFVLANDVISNCGRRRRRQPPSILAELHSPANAGSDLTYEDLARNIDANLAEIDMEDFRSEDINSILALPAMYCGSTAPEFLQSQEASSGGGGGHGGEQTASLSGSILARFGGLARSCGSLASGHHSTSGDSTDMSVCKSDEPLFSPVKENAAHLPTFSVDSLDCDSYDERELMLTCQANMNNYTIAFEGSFAKYSDDSDYHEAVNSETTDSVDSWSPGQFKLRGSDSVDGSLVQSDFVYTTWSKLKRVSEVQQQSAIESGSPPSSAAAAAAAAAACKSQSLPNLFRKSGFGGELKLSQLNISMDSEQCVPVFDIAQSQSTHSAHSRGNSSTDGSQQSLSLMRLFMQQRTSSGSSSGTPSVSNSLSSGTLHQMSLGGGGGGVGGGYHRSDSLSSTDERLYGVKFGNYCINCSSSCDDGSSSKEDGGESSRDHLHHNFGHRCKIDKTSRGATKRSIKPSGGGGATCKLYGGEVFHEDASGRTVSPLASPIEEEEEKLDDEDEEDEENEEMLDWSSSFNKETVIDARDVSSKHSDTPPDMEDSIDDISDDTMTRNNNATDDKAHHDVARSTRVTVINNLKPGCKSTNEKSSKSSKNRSGSANKLAWADDVAEQRGGSPQQTLSQGTQTKRLNNRSLEELEPLKVAVHLMSHSVQTSDGHSIAKRNPELHQQQQQQQQANISSSSSGYTSGSVNNNNNNNNQKHRHQSSNHSSREAWPANSGAPSTTTKSNVMLTKYKTCGTQIPVHVCDEAVQTSFVGEWLERVLLDSCTKIRVADCIVQTENAASDGATLSNDEQCKVDSSQGRSTAATKKSLYICYPNYSLPDLDFLREAKNKELSKMIHKLMPTKPTSDSAGGRGARRNKNVRPHSCTGLESLRNVDFSHIQDWDSLNVLLPRNVRDMLHQLRAKSLIATDNGNGSVAAPTSADHANNEKTTKDVVSKPEPNKEIVAAQLANMYVYKYDNSDLDALVEPAGPRGAPPPPPPLPKRSISLPQGDSHPGSLPFVFSKPPLPKSILRRPNPHASPSSSSSSSGAAASKRHPNAATKRYSMPDFGTNLSETCDCPNAACLDSCHPNLNLASILGYELAKLQTPASREAPPCGCDIVREICDPSTTGTSCLDRVARSCDSKCLCSRCALARADVGVVAENLKVVAGVGVVTADDHSPRKCSNCTSENGSKQLPEDHQCVCDMCQCTCAQGSKNKKSVSFSSKLCDEGDVAGIGHGPNVVKDAVKRIEIIQDNNLNSGDRTTKPDNTSSKDWPSIISEDSETEGAPQEFCVSPKKDTNRVNAVPSLDNDFKALDKWIGLLGHVTEAVEILNSHFNQTKDPHLKFILGSGLQTPSMGHKILNHLCPALFAILDDGLQIEIFNTFGHLYNSVWMVVEATTQSGNCTKQMSELVVHINNEHGLREKKMKFNAFIFGLLNTRSLDTWFALLGSCHGILQKHYSPDAFLCVVKSRAKPIFDELLLSLQSTSLLPFDLDLSLEIDLHKSLQHHQQHHRHNCVQRTQQQQSRDVATTALTARSWTTSTTPRPAVPPKTDRTKLMAHRHSCGHLDNYESDFVSNQQVGGGGGSNLVLESNATAARRVKPSHLQLRRGYSEDSAFATGSSGYSTGGRTTASSTPDDDASDCGVNNRYPRPNSICGAWVQSPTRGSPEKLKRWSCAGGGNNADDFVSGDPSRKYINGAAITRGIECPPLSACHLEVMSSKQQQNMTYNEDGSAAIIPSGGLLQLAGRGDMLEKNLKNEDIRTSCHGKLAKNEEDGAEKRDEEKAAAIEALLMATTKELQLRSNLNREAHKDNLNLESDFNHLAEKFAGEIAIIQDGGVGDDDDDDEESVKFKELQLRWEIMSGASSDDKSKKSHPSPNAKSRIPRLVCTQPTTGAKTAGAGKLDDSLGVKSTASSADSCGAGAAESPSKTVAAVEHVKTESSVTLADCNNRTKVGSKTESTGGGATAAVGNKNSSAGAKTSVAAARSGSLNQPSIVVKSSLDKSPIRKRVTARRVPPTASPNLGHAKSKQTTSRGVGGPDHLD